MAGVVGKVIGGYRILGEIGQGGMATVYKAWDRRSRRVVAVKFLSPFLSRDPKFRARFQREARLLQALHHPKIVPVLDHGEEGGMIFLVMPYITVGTLEDRLKQGPIQVEDGRKIMAQIASAIQFAHDHGVIHRDIKPANILIDEKHNAWLSDFGFARAHDQPSSISGSTIIGTPAYMAPEQILGHHVTPRADQYALGVILFQLSTGRLPFEADTPMGQALKHATQPLPRPRAINPRLPDSVEAVLVRALSKDPNFRFGSVAGFFQAFDEALNRSIDAATGRLKPGAVGKPPKPIRLKPAAAASPTLAGRTLVALTRVLPNPTRVRKLRPLALSAALLLALPFTVWAFARVWSGLTDDGPALAALMETPGLQRTVDSLSTAFAVDDATRSPGELQTAVAGTLLPVFGATQTEAAYMQDAESGVAGEDPEQALGGGPGPDTLQSGTPGTSPTAPGLNATPTPQPGGPTPTPVSPGPTAGFSCSLIDLAGFTSEGKKISWSVRNSNGVPAQISAIRLDWPGANGGLFKVALNGSTIWVGSQMTSPLAINAWIGGEESRTFEGEAELELRFDDQAAGSGYTALIDFAGGCSVSVSH
jgi:predicted Ser/Thr protein kinase